MLGEAAQPAALQEQALQVCKARVTWSILGEAFLPTSHTRFSNTSQLPTQLTASKRAGVSQTRRGAGSQHGHFCGDRLSALSYPIALHTCEKWHCVSGNENKNVFPFWAGSSSFWLEWDSANRHCHLLAPRPSTDFPTNWQKWGTGRVWSRVWIFTAPAKLWGCRKPSSPNISRVPFSWEKPDLSPNEIWQLRSRHVILTLSSLCRSSANTFCCIPTSIQMSAQRRGWDCSPDPQMPPSTRRDCVCVRWLLPVTGPEAPGALRSAAKATEKRPLEQYLLQSTFKAF